MSNELAIPTPPPSSSQSIAALAAALAKAQGEMTGAKKDALNPHFKSKYADLASVWDACRPALSKNGLAVVQRVFDSPAGVGVRTTLMHSSGEWIEETLVVPVQQRTAQGFGSAITYARRYALQSMVGVAAEDDDGNEASAPKQSTPTGDVRQPNTRALAREVSARMAKPPDDAPTPIEQRIQAADPYASHKPLEECTEEELKARESRLLEGVKSKKPGIRDDAQKKLSAVQSELLRRMAGESRPSDTF